MKLKVKTLAQAFFDSFSTKTLHHVSEVLQSLEVFWAAYVEQESLRDYLGHPQISATDKKEKLKQILEASKISADTQVILLFLLSQQMMPALPRITSVLRELRNQHFEVMTAEAISATALTSEHEAHLKTILQKAFGVKTVELKTGADPEILGGVVIRAQGRVLDASLKTKLKTIGLALHA